MPPPRIIPGFLSPHAARALTGAAEQTEANRRDIERMVREGDELIPAKLTGEAGSGSGATSGSGDDAVYFSWVEQAYRADGSRYDKPSGLFGTATYMPARMPNGETIEAFPFQCFLRRTVVTSLGPEYEVVAGAEGGGGSGFSILDQEHKSYEVLATFSGNPASASATLFTLTQGVWLLNGFFEAVTADGTSGAYALDFTSGTADVEVDNLFMNQNGGQDYQTIYVTSIVRVDAATGTVIVTCDAYLGIPATTGDFRGWAYAHKLTDQVFVP